MKKSKDAISDKITVTFTCRQAERIMVDAENVASFSDSPCDAREMAQIAIKIRRAIDASRALKKKAPAMGKEKGE